jgi:hypothetical protein
MQTQTGCIVRLYANKFFSVYEEKCRSSPIVWISNFVVTVFSIVLLCRFIIGNINLHILYHTLKEIKLCIYS